VEHAEIFWSLFAVDMDQVLAEQPPDTWDAFPLFQILNDYLRGDGSCPFNSFAHDMIFRFSRLQARLHINKTGTKAISIAHL